MGGVGVKGVSSVSSVYCVSSECLMHQVCVECV